MQRALLGLLVGAVALAPAAAHASASRSAVGVVVINDGHRLGAGVVVVGNPGPAVWLDRDTGAVCVAYSYQRPTCTAP
jgi:hypothetical protein